MGKAYNDHVLIEIEKSQWATANQEGEEDSPNAGSGIVVGIPDRDDIMFFSNYSWILEASPFNEEMLNKVHAKMKQLTGKRVYFEKRADLGNTIEEGDRTFATIKLSKIIYVGDDK